MEQNRLSGIKLYCSKEQRKIPDYWELAVNSEKFFCCWATTLKIFFAAEVQHWIKKKKPSMDRHNSEILLHETHNAICYS